jgi:hypothetical protein
MDTPFTAPLIELTLIDAAAPDPYGSNVTPLITPVVVIGLKTGEAITPASVKTPAVTVTVVLVTEGLAVAKYVVLPFVVITSELQNTLNVGLISTSEPTATAEN